MASSASMSSPSGPRGSRSPSVTSDDNNGSRFTTPDPDMVKQYQELMATILPLGAGAAPPPAAQAPVKISLNDEGEDNDGSIVENGVKRPMTKAEKQNAKKKRRKEREREAKMDEVVARREEQEKEEMAKPVGESATIFRMDPYCRSKSPQLIPSFPLVLGSTCIGRVSPASRGRVRHPAVSV